MQRIVTPRALKRSAEFYRELAALLAAGVPVVQSIQTIQKHPPGRSHARLTARMAAELGAGSSLTEALTRADPSLPAYDLALVHAGEESGRLVECCRSLSNHYAARASLVERFAAKMLYPAFLLHFAVLVFPPQQLAALFLQAQTTAFVVQKLAVLIPLYALILGAVWALQCPSGAWRSLLERLLHAVPGLGTARRERALSRLASALEALLNAGVTVIEAWDLAVAASGSPALVRAVARWKPRVLAGSPPGEEIHQCPEFPEMFANLYQTGETSGQLDQELRHLSDYYADSSSRKLEQFALLSALAIYLGIMLLIAFFIIRFYIGYFQQSLNAF